MTERLSKINPLSPTLGVQAIQVLSTAAAASGDEVTIPLTGTNYAFNRILNVLCQVHTTEDSVIVTESSTCAVVGTNLVVTIAAGNDGKKRSILVFGD